MEPKTVDLLGPAGFYARVDPANPNHLLFDRTSVDDDTEVELTKPDDRFTLRFKKANRIVNFPPKWEVGTDLDRQFETRPPEARGPHEQPIVFGSPASKRIIALVEHETDGRQYTSSPLTVVER